MVLPFMLMGSMSTTSDGDFRDFKLIPDYWVSDTGLFRKVIVDSAKLDQSSSWAKTDRWFAPTDVQDEDLKWLTSMPKDVRSRQAQDVREFLSKVCPPKFKVPLYIPNQDSPFSARDRYRAWLKAKYGSIEATNAAHGDNAGKWDEFEMPEELTFRAPFETPRVRDYRTWVEGLPPDQVALFNANVETYAFVKSIKLPRSLAGRELLTITYDDLIKPPFTLADRKQFFIEKASLRFGKIDLTKAGPAWQQFLDKNPEIKPFPLKALIPTNSTQATVWAKFVQQSCPPDALDLDRPELSWRAFLGAKYSGIQEINTRYNTNYTDLTAVPIPFMAFQYEVFLGRVGDVRNAYLTHNYRTVLEFIAIHGSALQNTGLLIIFTLVGTLTVNPLAAYALSRFRLKESHQILVFLLATMAFPGEVLMIPGFLQIKQFPLGVIVASILCLAGYAVLYGLMKRLPFLLRVFVPGLISAAVAGFVLPKILEAVGLPPSVSLMNTFWAITLPGLASGFGIFLLKGFFDSLPPELYEAGLLDGAGEFTMFWRITLPLSKPILAVMALGSFTAAYGAFMHAFLVAQDPRMWTLMVFLYEFQQTRSVPMVMASLVIAAVPTLVMFVACQRIIMQGIVIPTYK